jgi:serine/threonine protein kinase
MNSSYILVVDDSKPSRAVLVRALEREGYRVLAAEEGETALEIVASNPISLILLDLEMPGLGGLEVLKYLRARYSFAELAILIVSASSESPEVVKAIDTGANDYLYKPLNLPIMLAKVRQQLGLLVSRSARAEETAIPHLFLQDEAPQPGGTLNQYQVVELIGEGGMGQVFRAFDKRLHRDVALKVLHASRMSLAELDALLYEGRIIARVDHPGVVRVFEVSFDPYPYIAMELLVGQLLYNYVTRDTTIEAVCDLVIQVLDALEAIHSKGIIHRDLKPGNVMVTGEGRIKLMDFGLAGNYEALASSQDPDSICGTPQYASPEHFDARLRPITTQSDLFSAGIILYEMLTGFLPFSGSNFIGLACAIIEDVPNPPEQHRSTISAELSAVCMKALKKSKTERYADAASFARALRSCRQAYAMRPSRK